MPAFTRYLPLLILLAVSSAAAGENTLSAPAKLTAISRVQISSDIAAVVTAVKVRDGERFQRGDLLASFDCTELRAKLQGAQVQRDTAKRQLQSNRSLQKLGGNISQLELLRSEAQLAEATAQARVLEHRAGNCKVRAPFDGFVIQRKVEPYQRAEIGTPLFELVNNHGLEVEAIVPSTWLRHMAVGDRFRVRIDETAAAYDAILLRIVPAVDPVTRTVRVIGRIESAGTALITGMSGKAFFPQEKAAVDALAAGESGAGTNDSTAAGAKADATAAAAVSAKVAADAP